MIDLATHPWMRGLFGDEAIAAVFAPDADLKRFLQIEAAWTRALGEVVGASGTNTIARLIEDADITPANLGAGFAYDGVPIPALVKLLKAQIGPDGAQWVHMGLTSQDVMDTSLILALLDVLHIIVGRIDALDKSLTALQDTFAARTLMGYTRMQPALQTTAAEVVGQWRRPLDRLRDDLGATAKQIAVIQWGGPMGARDYAQADQLGPAFAHNLTLQDPGYAWHTDRTHITNVVNLLTRVSIVTGKMGEDVALMAAIGPAQITLSGGSSSAMAHKNNPVKAEALISLADFASALQGSLMRAARHEGFRSGRAWTLEWLALPQLCLVVGAGLTQAGRLAASIKTIGKEED